MVGHAMILGKLFKQLKFARYSIMFITKGYSIALVNFYLPVIIKYDENRLPPRAAAMTTFFRIIINPRFRADLSVVTHEMAHVRQIMKSLGFHFVRYAVSNEYRYKSELEAYAYQCLHLCLVSDVGLNNVLVQELTKWVTRVLSVNMNFSVLLLKSEEEIQKEFFDEFLKLLRLHKAEFEKT